MGVDLRSASSEGRERVSSDPDLVVSHPHRLLLVIVALAVTAVGLSACGTPPAVSYWGSRSVNTAFLLMLAVLAVLDRMHRDVGRLSAP